MMLRQGEVMQPFWIPNRRKAWLMAGSISLLGLLATLAVFLFARREAGRDFQRTFQEEASSQVNLLAAYLNERLLFLDDLARHLELTPQTDPKDFRAFVAKELARVKGIQALEWAPLTMPSARGSLEAQLRRDQGSGKGITERDGHGVIRRAGSRPLYYPVFFLAPLSGNQAALGYDLGSNPARLAAIEAARDSGESRATEPITLVQETQSQAGFLIYMPVYGKGLPTRDVSQRRRAFRGVVLGVFRTGDLIAAALSDRPHQGLVGTFQDKASSWDKGPLYIWGDGPASDSSAGWPPLPTRLLLTRVPVIHQQLTMAGRTWDLQLQPSSAFIARNLQKSAWFILGGGLALSGLLASLFFLVYSQKERAEEQVRDRTRAIMEGLAKLESREEDLRLLLDSTAEAIYGVDLEGRCTFCNQALLRMLGYPDPEAIIGQNMHDLIHHTRPDRSPYPVEECQLFRAFREDCETHAEAEVIWRADGTSLPVECWSFPQRRAGRAIGAVVTCIDISDRLQAAAEIQKNQTMVRNLLDSIPDMIFFKNLEGEYLACNLPLLELFGRTQEAVLGHTDDVLMDALSAGVCRQQDLLVLATNEPRHNDEWVVYPDGRRALFDFLKTPFHSPSGELLGILAIGRDITARKAIEDGLRQRDQLLEAVSRALVDLLDAPAWEGALQPFLSLLGTGAGASRAYLFQVDPGRKGDTELYITPVAEWCAEGVARLAGPAVSQVIPVHEAGFERWAHELGANRSVAGPVEAFPPTEQTWLQALGIRSLLLMPIFVKGRLSGVIGLDECTGTRAWSGPEQDILTLSGRALGIVIERQETLRELETARADLEHRVLLRTQDLRRANQELTNEVSTRHRAESRLTVITQGFLNFGPNTQVNLNSLLRLFRDLTGAGQVFYLSTDKADRVARFAVPEPAGPLPTALHDLDAMALPRNRGLRLEYEESGSCRLSKALAQGVWAEERIVGVLVGCRPAGPDWTVEDETVLGILAAAAGIEEQRQLGEAERQRAQLQLLQAQKLESVGRLAAGIAHEINTPIQFLSMNLRFLHKTYATLLQAFRQPPQAPEIPGTDDANLAWIQEETPKVLQDSMEGIARVAHIVRAMKEFSHPGHPDPVVLDINKNLESAVTVSKNEWKYVAEVRLELAPGLPAVHGFPAELNQVFLNLIVNAAQAIAARPRAEGQFGTIHISTASIRSGVEIQVQDTGTGILPEHQGKIFDPFFTTKDVGVGTGQGLHVCYQTVVNLHGGEISFTTTPGRGTTFIVRLPTRAKTASTVANEAGSA
jgi:PAS domain S-box-containing protein